MLLGALLEAWRDILQILHAFSKHFWVLRSRGELALQSSQISEKFVELSREVHGLRKFVI